MFMVNPDRQLVIQRQLTEVALTLKSKLVVNLDNCDLNLYNYVLVVILGIKVHMRFTFAS